LNEFFFATFPFLFSSSFFPACFPYPCLCQFDRFIPNRSAMDKDVSHFQLTAKENAFPVAGSNIANNETVADKNEYQRAVANCLFSGNEGSRILAFRNKPPENIKQDLNAMYAQARGGSPRKQQAAVTRALPQIPEKVLDAPGILDDFYLNLLDWSYDNLLAIGLRSCVYLWNASTGAVTDLVELPEGEYVSSVAWINGCNGGGGPTAYCSKPTLAVGTSSAQIQLWDAAKKTKMRTMTGHAARVGSMSWNAHVLSSGCRDGSIYHHDVRMPNHMIAQLEGHTQEVCGLRWSPDGTQIASGGNDNIVNIYDGVNSAPRHTKTQHKAAVKVIIYKLALLLSIAVINLVCASLTFHLSLLSFWSHFCIGFFFLACRLFPGAHGSRTCWQLEEEPAIVPFDSGTLLREPA
jgi:cell division cycle protein 20 (cofactor of APC complex)